MKYQQYLIFEVGTSCNLACDHKKCPSASPERYMHGDKSKQLDDETIINTAERFYKEFGFRGMVGFHYYNEPLLQRDRIVGLCKAIKERVPSARFILWTNGTLLGSDCEDLAVFDQAHMTDYGIGTDVSPLRAVVKDTKTHKWQLDARLDKQRGDFRTPCNRTFSEFIFDAYGNAHLCCIDWRGECALGNLFNDDLESIVDAFVAARDSMAKGRDNSAPMVCRRCRMALKNVSPLVKDIAVDAVRYAKNSPKESEKKKIGDLKLITLKGKTGAAARSEFLKAHKDGFYFGIALKDTEELKGKNIQAALNLHPNENMLQVRTNHGRIRSIVRLSDLAGVEGFEPTVRGRRVPVLMNELSIHDSAPPPARRLAVIFTHYKIPETRLQEHFAWNDDIYRRSGASVFVVTDKEYPVPDYATCLVYPGEMEKFNLSATSNFGIRYAADCGYDAIIKTDTDLVYSEPVWEKLSAVEDGRAIVPLYLMAKSYKNRATDYVEAPKATGTVAMTAANWRKAHYHEGCEGYGSDDAIILKAIQKAGIAQDRAEGCPFWHIAHIEGTPQKEFDKLTPRIDHWNRDNDFNPENFSYNRQFYKKPVYRSERWGLGGLSNITIVAVGYRLPEERIRNFIEWNREEFEKIRARVIIVTDRELSGLPGWVRVAVYPDPLEVFNLAKTSNYGIRMAATGVICKTDIDCVFTSESIAELGYVRKGRGVCIPYRMAPRYGAWRDSTPWDGSKGTMALAFADWDKINGYDERMFGYGIEDGDAFTRAGQVAEVTRPGVPFYHIAHKGGEQVNQSNRKDQWGREDNFNPRNHTHNRRQMYKAKWQNAAWGLPV